MLGREPPRSSVTGDLAAAPSASTARRCQRAPGSPHEHRRRQPIRECRKVGLLGAQLGLACDWHEVDVTTEATREADLLALKPAGEAPVLLRDDGRTLAQSNAVLVDLGDGTPLLPAEPFRRAKVFDQVCWETYSHAPYIAGCRFQIVYESKPAAAREP
jgi:glutathione S-transferase